jgi:surface protein
MFHAQGLEELDVSNWDVSNVTTFNSMFFCGGHILLARVWKLDKGMVLLSRSF